MNPLPDFAKLKRYLDAMTALRTGRDLVVFGTGDAAQLALAALDALGVPVAYLVDNDSRQQGTSLQSHAVHSPAILDGRAARTLVLVASVGRYVEIVQQLLALGFVEGESCLSAIPRPQPSLPPMQRRRTTGGQLLCGLTTAYIAARDAHAARLVDLAMAGGDLESALQDPRLADFDERVLEYTSAVRFLRDCARTGPIEALDAGCVLNNPPVVNAVRQYARRIWFLNQGVEIPVYPDRVGLIKGDMRTIELPAALSFDAVTCLSTFEHIGMDNRRYGGSPAETDKSDLHPERFARAAVQGLTRLLKPGGRMLLSLPYGVFEYVYLYGKPDDPIYYTFDEPRLRHFLTALGSFDYTVRIYRLTRDRGWFQTDAGDRNFALYADGFTSCNGTAIIEAMRRP